MKLDSFSQLLHNSNKLGLLIIKSLSSNNYIYKISLNQKPPAVFLHVHMGEKAEGDWTEVLGLLISSQFTFVTSKSHQSVFPGETSADWSYTIPTS